MERNPRIVIDSNVVISGLVFGGAPYTVLLLAISGQIQSVLSAVIIREIEEAFEEKFHLSVEDRELTLTEYTSESEKVELRGKMAHVVRDKDDDKIIQTALLGQCSYIVTGDKDLLVLGKYKSIKIVSPKEFLEELTE